jgi:hypothetical protein
MSVRDEDGTEGVLVAVYILIYIREVIDLSLSRNNNYFLLLLLVFSGKWQNSTSIWANRFFPYPFHS